MSFLFFPPYVSAFSENAIYDHHTLLRAKLELLNGTSLYDYAIESYCEFYNTEEAPEGLYQQKEDLLQEKVFKKKIDTDTDAMACDRCISLEEVENVIVVLIY